MSNRLVSVTSHKTKTGQCKLRALRLRAPGRRGEIRKAVRYFFNVVLPQVPACLSPLLLCAPFLATLCRLVGAPPLPPVRCFKQRYDFTPKEVLLVPCSSLLSSRLFVFLGGSLASVAKCRVWSGGFGSVCRFLPLFGLEPFLRLFKGYLEVGVSVVLHVK